MAFPRAPSGGSPQPSLPAQLGRGKLPLPVSSQRAHHDRDRCHTRPDRPTQPSLEQLNALAGADPSAVYYAFHVEADDLAAS